MSTRTKSTTGESGTRPRARDGYGGSSSRQCRALVLRRYRYAETSLLVHLLTAEHGRVSVLAKGAYRRTSRYSGVLDLFDTLQLSYRTTPRSELGLLTAGSIERRRFALCRDLVRYRAALGVLELAGLGAREEHEEGQLFALVEAALDALSAKDSQTDLIGVVFELQFLRTQGLTPALSDCASCGSTSNLNASPSGDAVFSPALGGRLCRDCAASADSRSGGPLETLPAGAAVVAQSLIDTPFAMLPRVHLDSRRTERLRGFVRRFLEYHLETRPRAWGPSPHSSSQARRASHTRTQRPPIQRR